MGETWETESTRGFSLVQAVCTAVLQKMHQSEANVQCHVGHFDWDPVLILSILIDFFGNHGKVSSLFIA